MQQEADRRQFGIPVTKVHERVASATGISKSARKIIKKEMLNVQAGAATSNSTPKRNRNRPRTVTKIDDVDMCVVRRTIHEFCLREKRLPTVKAVLTKLRECIGYKGQASSLLKIFKELGFRWRRMRDNRSILIKKQDVRCARVAFLRAIAKFRRDGRVIVYSDETYIHSSHTTKNRGLTILLRDVWRQPPRGNGLSLCTRERKRALFLAHY
jgi:hypothetical protein